MEKIYYVFSDGTVREKAWRGASQAFASQALASQAFASQAFASQAFASQAFECKHKLAQHSQPCS